LLNLPSSGYARVPDQVAQATRSVCTLRHHCTVVTIIIPDDVAEAVDNYLQAQEVRPALTILMQTALREYLSARGFPPAGQPLKTPKRTIGQNDVGVNHDYYLARNSRKVGRKAAPARRSAALKAPRKQS
jgi:hypothetical protein